MSEHLVHMLRFGAVGDQFSRDMCSSACPPIESFHLSSIRAGQDRATVSECPADNPASRSAGGVVWIGGAGNKLFLACCDSTLATSVLGT